MPRQAKGPRLYLRKGRIDPRAGPLPDRYFIRDGAREIGTGCGPERVGDAERALAAYISEKWNRPNPNSDPAAVLVADALAFYNKGRGKSLASDAATLRGFTRHLLIFWTGKTLADVRRSTCEAYVESRTAQDNRNGSGKVTVQTARRELEHLSAAIGYWNAETPLMPLPKVTLPAKPESHRDALTRSQAAGLLWAALGHQKQADDSWRPLGGSAKANRAHLRRFLLIGFYTGSRSGVIKRLRWVESLTDPWVDVEKGVIYRRGRNETESRTKRRPLVRVPPRLLSHLRRWKAADEKAGHALVVHHGGRQVSTIRRGFAACAKEAGVEATPHWLRHTAATWLMEGGADPWEAAGYLGMTAATLEKHYGSHRPDYQADARRAMR